MALKLFEHNAAAYYAAVNMMKQTGKAAIIHPTGTGKSFIGFKLAEDNPNKRILWLTPSEYIVKTQLENLNAEGGFNAENITFITYARLMMMSDDDINDLKPDYMVCDELHRLGAECWGDGYNRLCICYPDAKRLGLSATHIRYLDNQRDMAEELFDGNVASKMTLGEAIARGILTPPKYVLSIFSYQKELEKYRQRAAKLRNKTVRNSAEKYLEALRRTLDKAEGLPEIFKKHMTDRNGKYIVFCANQRHMSEMAELAPKWFEEIDANPHIFSAYSDNSETSREFNAFKADNSNHLKLLFCIDMLNEGVHIDGISGVILLRPTVSPIVYKQQIGRALSVGKKNNSVIFDIVLNFENLYSISNIKEEMNEAIIFYQKNGEADKIVNETFEVIDEVRDCRKLFEELERTLSAPWDYMYDSARRYYSENGNLLPKKDYTDENGYGLGRWIAAQRTAYANCELSESKIFRLESIGMEWSNRNERLWEDGFNKAKTYYERNGSLESGYDGYDEIKYWVIHQRQNYRNNALPAERVEKLNSIGIVWDAWQESYEYAKAYFDIYGNLDIPANYMTDDGFALGIWYRTNRKQYIDGTMQDERRKMLEDIGINAQSVKTRTWKNYFELARKYVDAHGNLNVNSGYETDGGVKLGVWISSQRYMYGKGKLTQNQIELLESIGMEWNRHRSSWNAGYEYAKEYYLNCKDINVPVSYITDDGFALGSWINVQRTKNASGKLSDDRKRKLDILDIVWSPSKSVWNAGYDSLKRFVQANHTADVPGKYIDENGFKLGVWITNQRSLKRSGKLSAERIDRLNNIGFIWNPTEEKWRRNYECAKEYYLEYGTLNVPKSYIASGGLKLNEWLRAQKRGLKNGVLTVERQRMLNKIGAL